MGDIFYKPNIEPSAITVLFPYTREKLCERPMFPTYVFDGGAAFFAFDQFGTIDSDSLLPKIMDGSLFAYWKRDDVFDWCSVYQDFGPIGYTPEWEGHIWINRLYILLIVAQKFCRTKDEVYARAWLRILKEWYEANPYPENGDSPRDLVWKDMQVTWRAINLVHSIFLLGECRSFTQKDWNYIYDLVKIHGTHMFGEGLAHARSHAVDNHNLQNGTALIMFGTLFPELFDSREYISVGAAIVSDNMRGSIFADGCNNEDSMSYSHFIARLYLEAELLLKKNGYPVIQGCSEAIQKQYEFLYQFAAPDGMTLQVGDSYAMDAWADISFVDSIHPLTFSRERRTCIFEASRMAVLRNSRFAVYVDAMDMTEWHQHYGRPHVLIYADGKPILVDSGSVNYDRGGLRYHLNGPEGHNVIFCPDIPLEDNLTQSTATEVLTFEPFEQNAAFQKLVITNKVTASDGRWYFWRRMILLYDDRLEIHDSVDASTAQHFISRMHLPNARTGYLESQYPYQPVSADKKTVSLRFGSMMETVITDTPVTVEYVPCADMHNRMNYSQVLVRKHFTNHFQETTTFRYDRLQ